MTNRTSAGFVPHGSGGLVVESGVVAASGTRPLLETDCRVVAEMVAAGNGAGATAGNARVVALPKITLRR